MMLQMKYKNLKLASTMESILNNIFFLKEIQSDRKK